MNKQAAVVGIVGMAVGVVVGAVGAGALRPVEAPGPDPATVEPDPPAPESGSSPGEVAHGDWSLVTRQLDDGTPFSRASILTDDIRIEVGCHAGESGSYSVMLFLQDGLFDNGLVAAQWSVGEPEYYRFRDLNDTYLSGHGRPLFEGYDDPDHVEGLDLFVLGLRTHLSLDLLFFKSYPPYVDVEHDPDIPVDTSISLLGAPTAIEALGC